MTTQELTAKTLSLWNPPKRYHLSEWAEEHFYLSPEYSAKTGRLRLYEFQREPLDAFTDPYTNEVVVMSATQMLKTLVLQVAAAYTMAVDPGPMMLVQPSEGAAREFSKERIDPMIRDIPALQDVVSAKKARDANNTLSQKVFRGGSLSLVGAQSPDNFARRSLKVVLFDEIDKYPPKVGNEGDAISLAVKRGATFRSRFKAVKACSPTIEGRSQIAQSYENSDQRKFYVPCPHCGEYQLLTWTQVRDPRFPGSQPETTAYECLHCTVLWFDADRWTVCERGVWRASKPFRGIAGFWISELYSPWKTLAAIADDYFAKRETPALFQTFVNTSLAETWREKGDAPEYQTLMDRVDKTYRLGEVPEGVLFLTAGTDVQKHWIETYVWGWGRGKQRWLIDHIRIDKPPTEESAWTDLDAVLERRYRHPSGASLPLVKFAIDTGHATQEVYNWVRKDRTYRVLGVDGRATGQGILGKPSPVDVTVNGRVYQHGLKIWPVNVSAAKMELYDALQKEPPEDGQPFPPGYVHFPADVEEEFFKQITAEQLLTKYIHGYPRRQWQKLYNRNEALDCANYARAAAITYGIDSFNEDRWRKLEQDLNITTAAPVQRAAPEVVHAPQQIQRPGLPLGATRPSGGWLNRRQGSWL